MNKTILTILIWDSLGQEQNCKGSLTERSQNIELNSSNKLSLANQLEHEDYKTTRQVYLISLKVGTH